VAVAGAAPTSVLHSSATASQAAGAVVFTSTRDGDSDIYAVNPDGTGLTQLTNEPDDDSGPLPSPDGRHIVFQGVGGAEIMEADGSGRRSLPDCSFSPEGWSPDSRHVVCSDYEKGIQVLDTVDGTATQLADSGRTASWSPDGRKIAFIDEYRLFVIPAAGGPRRRLGIHKAAEFAAPTWSPDSQRVAYISPGGGDRYALWTIRADGSGGRRVAQNVDEWTPSWSPDGSRIAFVKSLAHYVSAVYVVRTDGTHLHRVSDSHGGESAREPSWSADGRLVLYIRGRFREAEASDIFAVGPAGHGGRALTHPFPAGGSNYDAHWLKGPLLSGGEQLPPTMTAQFKRKLAFAQPIVSIATDGTRAVPRLKIEKHPALSVWDSATGRIRRGPAPCGELYGPGFLALAGDRLAWTCSERGNTYYAVGLFTSRIGDRRPKSVASADGDNEGGDDIVNIIGRGGRIAFSERHQRAQQDSSDPWLLLTRKAKKCPSSSFYHSGAVCRPLGRGRGLTTAVDAGRVATVAPSGVVRILTLGGRELRSWNLGEGVVTARLRGRTLVVQHADTIDAYDAQTGAKRQSRELRTDGGPLPFLLDVQGDLVLYETGGAIHLLRLSDGRDRALRLRGAAPSLDARLEPAGLFVSWNKMYDRRPGRLAFIPLRVVRARL
jgi:TolB protein